MRLATTVGDGGAALECARCEAASAGGSSREVDGRAGWCRRPALAEVER